MATAAGVIMNAGFAYINAWTPEKAKVYMITVVSSGPLLNVIQNQIITKFVNPLNLIPDIYRSPWVFFSQPEILHRVPKVIAVIAAVDLGPQLISLLLVSIPPAMEKNHAIDSGTNHDDSLSTIDNKTALAKPENESLVTRATEKVSLDISQHCVCRYRQEDSGTKQIQYTLQEAIKTIKFWTLWLYGASTGLCTLVITSYYKQFGLVYIRNDKHLTFLGSFMPLLSGACGMVLGVLKKKNLINVNGSLVLSLSVNSLASAFLFFAAKISEAVYMILVLLTTFAHSFIYFVLANGTVQEFGNVHFATIYSVVYSGRPILSLLSAIYLTPLLDAVGWFWVFISSAFFSFIALTFMVVSHFISPRI
ncbi:hypothetical protein RRG08_008326 [Elysia crispata]|uniref:Uncharacterized protein n=1 Tax=Elysia crispata TaxID=231223 RepID=A0AAE1A720_9GAST|nr:hypothetical protein RRG08_008326 [Elysia crispata]